MKAIHNVPSDLKSSSSSPNVLSDLKSESYSYQDLKSERRQKQRITNPLRPSSYQDFKFL